MKSKQETFASLMDSFSYKHDVRTVFDDFLTMALCAFSQNIATGMSYDEDLYMTIIVGYPKELQPLFSQLLALLTLEMEERFDSRSGNDVLGEFYELNFCRKGSGQFFTPYHICDFMAQITCGDHADTEKPQRIIDPACGSGRTLLAGAKTLGTRHRYYGIDIDHTCVKMTAINLFMNGIFHGEVMWADTMNPNDFRMSYVLSFAPFGVFRIQEKEKSWLWHMQQNALKPKAAKPIPSIILPSKEDAPTGNGSQLQLF